MFVYDGSITMIHLIFIYVYGCFSGMYACVYVCRHTVCMSGALGSQKALGSLELELHMVISCHVGVGN